jgi:hypothetical protein
LKKSVRTLEDWYGRSVMPQPAVVGGTCYWHPEIFFGWLDARLKGRAWPPAAGSNGATPEQEVSSAEKGASPEAPRGTSTSPAGSKRGKKADGMTASARARAKDAARLQAMNDLA